jgi:hypothetical protein
MYRLIRTVLPLCALAMATAGIASAQGTIAANKKLPASMLKKVAPRTARKSDPISAFGVNKAYGGTGKSAAVSIGIPGVDTLANWSDQFVSPGFDPNGNAESVWPYTMVGAPPESGNVTNFRAPIIPVDVDLLDADGKVVITFAGSQVAKAVYNSPVFESYSYPSGDGQFDDQMMRTQFWNRIHRSGEEDSDNGYHNYLNPSVKTTRHMQIPDAFWAVFVDGNGNPVAAAIDENEFGNLLFPATFPFDNSTPVGAAENSGDITTKDISTFLFNNVYLYSGGNPNNCCILGYHTYDFEPGIPSNGNRQRWYVLNYSSWISPGLFFFGFEDITALSHEMSETFDDPFTNNVTPWWLSQDPFTGGANCQDDLEVGDVVEVLTTNPVYAAAVDGRTYHLQNEALLPWFAFQSPSHARNGTYSFPDETTLMSLSPGPLLPNCKPAP